MIQMAFEVAGIDVDAKGKWLVGEGRRAWLGCPQTIHS